MHNSRPRSKKTTSVTTAQLIRTLLRQVHPQDQVPSLLRIAYLSQDTTVEQPTPVFKYGNFIRQMVPDQDLKRNSIDIIRSSRVMDYAATHQLYDKYVTEGLILVAQASTKDDDLEKALEMDIHRQLTWALCQGCMERIEELVIPLTDIEQYIDHVDQFKSLSKVTFTVKKQLHLMGCTYAYEVHESLDRLRRTLGAERDRLFKGMLRFVQKHTSIHQHVLQQVVVPGPDDLHATSEHTTVDVWLDILCLLPPPQNPRSIDMDNWCEVVTRISDINLNHVKSIKLDTFGIIGEAKTLALLKGTLGPDMFQWAALERKKRDTENQQLSAVRSQLSSWQYGYYNELVPLRSIKITHRTPSKPVQELNDIAAAFGDTLEGLTVRDKVAEGNMGTMDLGAAHQVVHGQGWVLPHLHVLDFEASYSQLAFDMDALSQCCALESLRLADGIATYNHRGILPWPPVCLPHLKKLDLTGSPALFFNLDSLHHSPCLEELSLGMPKVGWMYYIPSPDEMHEDLETEDFQGAAFDGHWFSGTSGSSQEYNSIERRPRLPWGWHLPNLSRLDLKAVFAYKFEFQLLQYLVSLQFLRLNTTSTHGRHHMRTVTLKDLSRETRQEQDNDLELNLSNLIFSSPTLRTIDLEGQWRVDALVLEALCLVVAPNLREISFGRGCVGFSLHNWVKLSRRMPHINLMKWDQILSVDEIRDMGLRSIHDPQGEHRNKRCIKHIIGRATLWDVLDR
ncbi:hypothetical protein BGX34_002096 [Mortierella sp. NVP85]|nr:hypothetical protein BGX34_002096 [Mortierella sp. NVP85]